MKTKRPPASDAVRREWLRRVEAEYRSAAITQHLGLWLIQIGASPDLVRRAMRIAADEIAHAEMSHRTYVAAGGRDLPAIVRESLALVRHEDDPLEHDVARVAVEVFCLGETVAVPLFKALREGCTVPVARRALDRVLRDEVRHRDFGWTLLAWLMEHPDAPAMRALIEAELATWFARLSASYAPEPKGERDPPVRDDDRAWGLMPLASYRAAVDKTFARDWEPRFAKLGFDAQKAWSRCTGA